MVTVLEENGIQLVDIFATINSYKTSVRDALLFLGFANAFMSPEIEHKVQRLDHNKQKLQKTENQLNFYPHSLKIGDMVEVKVVQITSPHLFYVMKVNDILFWFLFDQARLNLFFWGNFEKL